MFPFPECFKVFFQDGYKVCFRFQDGYEVGSREAEATGNGLGFQRAAQVASEVGFYEGFVQQLEASLSTASPSASPSAASSAASSEAASSPASAVASSSASPDRAARQLRRARPLLLALRRLIAELPRHNSTDGDVTAQLDSIRGKFRQLCAVLRVNPGASAQQQEISF